MPLGHALAAALLALLAFPSQAQSPHAKQEWRAAAPGLGAVIVLAKDPEKAVRRFNLTPPGQFLEMESASEVRQGEYIAALVFFTGCASACKVFVDYDLVGPDGKVRQHVPDKGGTDEPSPRKAGKTLSRAIVRFSFAPNDATGTYRVIAKVRDPSRNVEVQVSERFDVTR